MSIVIDTPEGIAFARMAALRSGLRLEISGMRRRGRSAYSICKSDYGLKGNRDSVLRQMTGLLEAAIAAKEASRG